MKRIILLNVVIILSMGFANNAFAQRLKGSSIFDMTYGYSIIHNIDFAFKGAEINKEGNKYGPVGLRYEYRVHDRIGLALEANYRRTDLEINYLSELDTLDYFITFSSSQFRMMGKVNFYMVNRGKFEMYGGLSLGYVNRSLRIKSNEIKFGYEYVDDFLEKFAFSYDVLSSIDFPFACRMQLGMRYYLTPYLALNMEMGAGGGSFFNGGLTAKF